jgi:hypothetical protein
MANPQAPLGTLNRLLVAVMVPAFPGLNVTKGYFGTKQARLAFEGATADYIPVQTGAVPSPRPYQICTVTMYLLKSQNLSALWEQQRLTQAAIGDVNVFTDSVMLSNYFLQNCILENVPDLDLTGESDDYPVTLKGTYQINGALFS